MTFILFIFSCSIGLVLHCFIMSRQSNGKCIVKHKFYEFNPREIRRSLYLTLHNLNLIDRLMYVRYKNEEIVYFRRAIYKRCRRCGCLKQTRMD